MYHHQDRSCSNGRKESNEITTGHLIQVVGYGSEGGVDYWLIKNSWGSNWGENGYIRLQRGVGMCGVGKAQVVVECAPVSGPTSATLTTEVHI